MFGIGTHDCDSHKHVSWIACSNAIHDIPYRILGGYCDAECRYCGAALHLVRDRNTRFYVFSIHSHKVKRHYCCGCNYVIGSFRWNFSVSPQMDRARCIPLYDNWMNGMFRGFIYNTAEYGRFLRSANAYIFSWFFFLRCRCVFILHLVFVLLSRCSIELLMFDGNIPKTTSHATATASIKVIRHMCWYRVSTSFRSEIFGERSALTTTHEIAFVMSIKYKANG